MYITNYTLSLGSDTITKITIEGYLEAGDDITTWSDDFYGKSIKLAPPPLDNKTKLQIDKLIENTTSRPIIHNAISQLKVKED